MSSTIYLKVVFVGFLADISSINIPYGVMAGNFIYVIF